MKNFTHKDNDTTYVVKSTERHSVRVKQNSDCDWESGVIYFNPMKPFELFVTGAERFANRFDASESNYNGDELYDDVFRTVHKFIKESDGKEIYSTDLTNEIIKLIQPKIEVLNNAQNKEKG